MGKLSFRVRISIAHELETFMQVVSYHPHLHDLSANRVSMPVFKFVQP